MNHLAKRVGILIVCLAISTICQGQTIHPAVSFKRTIGSDFLGTNAANVIRQISGVNDPNLVANAPKLKPLILRYPGGDIASWWDWHTGWFVNSVALPSKYYGLPFKPNTLENLQHTGNRLQCHGNVCSQYGNRFSSRRIANVAARREHWPAG